VIAPERTLGLERTRIARAVQIGSVWHEPDNVEDVLHRYCKHVFANTNDAEFPHAFPGSASAIRIAGRHFLFCCGHQIKDWKFDQIAFRPYNSNVTATGSSLAVPLVTEDNADTDYIDARIFEYEVSKYKYSNLAHEFFPLDQSRIWPDNSQNLPLLVYGYPTELQNVDYDAPKIAAHAVEVMASYEGGTSSPHLHRIRMDRKRRFNADGMSGGPVFYIGREKNNFFVGWAGMIMRGSSTSDLLHFLSAHFLIEMAFHHRVEIVRDR
jgi:hypothetical protein